MTIFKHTKIVILVWVISLTALIFANNNYKVAKSPIGTYITTVNGSISLTVNQDSSFENEEGMTKCYLSGKIDKNGKISSYTRSITLITVSENTFKIDGTSGKDTFTQIIKITGEKGAIITGSTSSDMSYELNVQRINHHEFEITGSRTMKDGEDFSVSPIRIHSKTLFNSALGFEPSMLLLSKMRYSAAS
jgi:hypothetical protein